MKQIKVDDVALILTKATLAKVWGLTHYPLPEGQYAYGIYRGINMALRLLLTATEVENILQSRMRDDTVARTDWSTPELFERFVERSQIEMANGMLAWKGALEAFAKQDGAKEVVVRAMTDMLREWEPR